MKRFTEYLNEDFDPAIFNADGGISINDPTVVDAINSNLEAATSCSWRTPYNGLEEVAKTLAYYKIFLPKGVFLDQNHGNDVFEVSQFGEKMGMNDQGEVVTASDYPLFVYFEWSLNEKGMYDTFACLCDQDELDEILADYDSEVETDEDLQEQHSMGKVSKMLYKVVNQAKAQKQSNDVDSYIEHEKQGKTFTQMCEEPMPDLKKKMGAKVKDITLAGQMRKEETLNEIGDSEKGKRAINAVGFRSDGEIVDQAMKSRPNKKKLNKALRGMSLALNANERRGGKVLNSYLKRSYGVEEEKAPFDNPTETPSTPYEKPKNKSGQLARAAMRAEIQKGKEEKKRLRKSLREK